MPPRSDPDTYGPPDKVLLVEGEDDKHTLWNLLERNGIHEGVRVEDKVGYERLRADLRARLRAGNERRLGVVVDADADLTTRWQSLRDVLAQRGYSDLPDTPDPNGTIVRHPDADAEDAPPYKPTIGIWLMPDNTRPGMLEDFAAALVKTDDPLWPRAAAAVAAIPVQERRFSPSHRSKAVLRTWLAWQSTPGQPIGYSIQKGDLRHDSEIATRLVAWLRTVFEL